MKFNLEQYILNNFCHKTNQGLLNYVDLLNKFPSLQDKVEFFYQDDRVYNLITDLALSSVNYELIIIKLPKSYLIPELAYQVKILQDNGYIKDIEKQNFEYRLFHDSSLYFTWSDEPKEIGYELISSQADKDLTLCALQKNFISKLNQNLDLVTDEAPESSENNLEDEIEFIKNSSPEQKRLYLSWLDICKNSTRYDYFLWIHSLSTDELCYLYNVWNHKRMVLDSKIKLEIENLIDLDNENTIDDMIDYYKNLDGFSQMFYINYIHKKEIEAKYVEKLKLWISQYAEKNYDNYVQYINEKLQATNIPFEPFTDSEIASLFIWQFKREKIDQMHYNPSFFYSKKGNLNWTEDQRIIAVVHNQCIGGIKAKMQEFFSPDSSFSFEDFKSFYDELKDFDVTLFIQILNNDPELIENYRLKSNQWINDSIINGKFYGLSKFNNVIILELEYRLKPQEKLFYPIWLYYYKHKSSQCAEDFKENNYFSQYYLNDARTFTKIADEMQV